MSDEAVTFATLVRYHKEILVPDFQRMLGGLEAGIEARFQGQLDAIYQRFDRLETEYQMLVAAVHRIEERMDALEARMSGVEGQLGALAAAQDKLALRSELQGLQARVDGLQAQIREVEMRLER